MEKIKSCPEVWKSVVGYEGLYQVSNKGRVKCLEKYVVSTKEGHLRYYPERLAKTYLRGGYVSVELSKNGKATKFSVHRLVASSFIRKPIEDEQVNHKDGDKLNNEVSNLEWVTPSINIKHAYDTGLRPKHHHRIAVKQLDHQGNILKKFISIHQASKQTNVDYSSIRRTCEGRYKQAGGFKWEYA